MENKLIYFVCALLFPHFLKTFLNVDFGVIETPRMQLINIDITFHKHYISEEVAIIVLM